MKKPRRYQRALCAAAIATSLALGSTAVVDAPLTEEAHAASLSDFIPEIPGVDPVIAQRIGTLLALLVILGIALPVVGTEGSSYAPDDGTGGAADGGYRGGRDAGFAPDGTMRRTINVGGRTRSYNMVLPAGHADGNSYPIIFGFGGWQHSAERAHEYLRLEDAATDTIIVYGQGVDNAWAGAPYAKTSINQDIAYVRTVIADLAENFGGDRNRVAAIGLSNGGGMAAVLGCHASDTVKAIASAAGAYYDPTVSNCDFGRVATLLMHGTRDDVINYNGGTRHGGGYQPVTRVLDTFGQKNGCSTRTFEFGGLFGTTTIEPIGCITPTRLMRVNGGGHTWFTRPDATRDSVDFVMQQL